MDHDEEEKAKCILTTAVIVPNDNTLYIKGGKTH